MRKNWMSVSVALLLAILAIGAVACGDDDDDGSEEPTATEVTVADPTEVPDDGDDMASVSVVVTDGILTDSEGNTLYTFDNDAPGLSNCVGPCKELWPALTTDGDAIAGDGVDGALGTIAGDDGAMHVTYNDQPLYYFLNDEAPGDRNGDGFGDVWHVVEVD